MGYYNKLCAVNAGPVVHCCLNKSFFLSLVESIFIHEIVLCFSLNFKAFFLLILSYFGAPLISESNFLEWI